SQPAARCPGDQGRRCTPPTLGTPCDDGQRTSFDMVERRVRLAAMPGSIQSIERAAAVLRLLGGAGRPLALAEVAAPLDLPRPTAHGILRTLRDVGFVDQDRDTGRYTLGVGLERLHGGWDRYELRARAMNWADSLAGSTGQEVLLGMPAGAGLEVVHHVFRPDGSPQRLRTGETLPLHATAVGKCLLAFAPVAAPPLHQLDL